MKASELCIEAVNPRSSIVEIRDVLRKWLAKNPHLEIDDIQLACYESNGEGQYAALILYKEEL